MSWHKAFPGSRELEWPLAHLAHHPYGDRDMVTPQAPGHQGWGGSSWCHPKAWSVDLRPLTAREDVPG